MEIYTRARQHALPVLRPTPDVLTAIGSTRIDLIQRMSTNDLAGLMPGEARPTVLTTAIGRIVDSLTVLSLDERLALITTPGRGERVLAWLRSHIFFQDDVRLEPWPLRQHWHILGPDAARALAVDLSAASDLGPGRGFAFDAGLVWRTRRPEPEGVHLLLDAQAPLPSALVPSVDPASAESAYQALRIEAGWAEFGREFDEGDIPLEVGLTHAVSFTKGCYLGQEIIARMESRARTPRRLVGVRLPGPIRTPAELTGLNGSSGRVTSAALSPRLGWIGLAVVRPQAMEGKLAVDGAPVEIVELPFPEALPANRQV